MSSACSNPLLYGWLNHNFRTEFKELYNVFQSFLAKCFGSKNTINNNNIIIARAERRPSHIYCGPTHNFDDYGEHHELHVTPNGRTRETLVVATSANDIPLAVSCEYWMEGSVLEFILSSLSVVLIIWGIFMFLLKKFFEFHFKCVFNQ